MIGAVSSYQPSFGLQELYRVNPVPAIQQPLPVQPVEKPAALDIQDRAAFSSRQGRIPAVQVKLFDDAPQQAASQAKPVVSHIHQAAASYHVTPTNVEHSRVAAEQVINPQPYAAEKGSLNGSYNPASHVATNQKHQGQESSSHPGSQKHQVFKPQQQRQGLFQDFKAFVKDVVSPGSSQPASGRISQGAARTVAPQSLYTQGRFSTVR